MPSIEISLSNDDSPCWICPARNIHTLRSDSPLRTTSDADRTCMALHNEHMLPEDGTSLIADHMVKNVPCNNINTQYHQHQEEHHEIIMSDTNHYFHDIISIHNEIEADEVVVDDSSSILDGTGFNPTRRRGRRANSGLIGRVQSMLQENFASRASMSTSPEMLRRRRPFAVHFVEHRV